MTGLFRGANGVEQLLRMARNDAETLRTDLAEIDEASLRTQEAIAKIDQEVQAEAGYAADIRALEAFREAMRMRRFNLSKTVHSLEEASEVIREKLRVALAETAKLEHLLETNRAECALRAHRREQKAAYSTPTKPAAIA